MLSDPPPIDAEMALALCSPFVYEYAATAMVLPTISMVVATAARGIHRLDPPIAPLPLLLLLPVVLLLLLLRLCMVCVCGCALPSISSSNDEPYILALL